MYSATYYTNFTNQHQDFNLNISGSKSRKTDLYKEANKKCLSDVKRKLLVQVKQNKAPNLQKTNKQTYIYIFIYKRGNNFYASVLQTTAKDVLIITAIKRNTFKLENICVSMSG